MTSTARHRAILVLALGLVSLGQARAQAPAGAPKPGDAQKPANTESPADKAVDQIRRLSSIGANDQRQIKNWIDFQVNRLNSAGPGKRADGMNVGALNAFRQAILSQINNKQDTPAFLEEFAKQMTAVALDHFKGDTTSTLRRALARAVVDIGRVETVPALLAGLSVPDQPTRYLCAQGLVVNRSAIAADNALLNKVIAEITKVGKTEQDGFVVGRLYDALAMPNLVGTVLPAYLAIFDARIAGREDVARLADSAEISAFEYLRVNIDNLTNDQRVELVKRLATMLRQDAVRYNEPSLAPPTSPTERDRGFLERDLIERRLDAIEDMLSQIVGSGKGGAIRDVLNTDGYGGHAKVLQEAYKWIGNADQKTTGALNAAPWNVPVGAK